MTNLKRNWKLESTMGWIVLITLSMITGCSKESQQTSVSFIPARGGLPNSSIIIKGMNFSTNLGANYVEFSGAVPGTVTAATRTQLTVTVPPNAASGPIMVVVNNSTRGITGTFNVLSGTVSTFSSVYVEHLAIDPTGIIYGDSTGSYHQTIVKFDQQGGASVFAGGEAFGPLWGVACDKTGNIFVCDRYYQLKITPSAQVSILAGSNQPGHIDGKGNQATFLNLAGVAVGPDNAIYVSDWPMVRKITQDGVVTTVAGLVYAGNQDGNKNVATFSQPEGIAVDGTGQIFVSDSRNYNIRKINTGDTVTTFAGSQTGKYGHADGQGTDALFYIPQAMAIDEAGNIFVSDSDYFTNNNFYIRMINAAGYVTTVLGGVRGNLNGSIETASAFGPDGIVFDAEGNLYFADTFNNSVRKITFFAK